jgi:hypothetical protein
MSLASAVSNRALNGICPYFTMFPITFPLTILQNRATPGEWVLDPFCGRGTTNYASRILGLPSVGIDSNPVAVAVTQAKLVNTSPRAIVRAARRILEEVSAPHDVPMGEFWDWAFHPDTLTTLCRLREGLRRDCRSAARRALRAVLLGALHGPRPRTRQSYFSNQAPRTYAPKPRYAVRFWQSRGLMPEPVDVMRIVEERAHRYYAQEATTAVGQVIHGDSRDRRVYDRIAMAEMIGWVVTSPPYYGMRTYLPDQWLRLWLVGGSTTVDYSMASQVAHGSPMLFTAQLKRVWENVGAICVPGAHLVVRFGGINDRRVASLPLLKESLRDTGWQIVQVECAGSASTGRRQALHFVRSRGSALEEHDVWARWEG